MADYVIGVDGGGTKTLGVLFGSDGTEHARTEGGYANFSVCADESRRHIETVIDTLLEQLTDADALQSIVLGIAGVSTLDDPRVYEKALADRYRTHVHLTSDAHIALHSVANREDHSVIMIVGGTGSIIMADDLTDVRIVGGTGHLLGEEGSGYHVVLSALKRLIAEFEDKRPHSSLSKRLMDALDARDRDAVVKKVYGGTKREIASLAKRIADAAKEKDDTAIALLEEEGRHLAEQASRAYRGLTRKKPLIVAMRGQFLTRAPHVREALVRHLRATIGEFLVDNDPVEPVMGAYRLGKKISMKRWDHD